MPATRHPAPIGVDSGATQQSRTTVAAFLNALAAGDRYGDHLAEHVTHTIMETGEVTTGREAVVRLTDHLYREAFAVSPELRGLVVEGQRAFLEADFVGTHVGEFAGILPTRRTVEVPFAVACDLAGGKITALRVYLPLDALVRQVRDASSCRCPDVRNRPTFSAAASERRVES